MNVFVQLVFFKLLSLSFNAMLNDRPKWGEGLYGLTYQQSSSLFSSLATSQGDSHTRYPTAKCLGLKSAIGQNMKELVTEDL